MRKREFFIEAMKASSYKYKSWLLSTFSVCKLNKDIPWSVNHTKDGLRILDGNMNIIDHLDDHEYIHDRPTPVYSFKDKLELKVGDIPNLKKDIETTYGNLLVNWLLLVYPFGSKIDYMEGKITINRIENIIEVRLRDMPEDEVKDPSFIYTDEYYNFRKATGLLEGISSICVPSVTPKALTTHPDVPRVRKELLEKYKDKLHDPSIVAMIEGELKKLDKQWLEGDDALNFYIKKKKNDVARKKTHLMFGLTNDIASTNEILVNAPLKDGWKAKDFPAYINNSRGGTFDRSSSTELGGEATKTIFRIMQNATISEDDCGSKEGFEAILTDQNKNWFLYNYMLVGDSLVKLDESNVDKYIGKKIKIRTPLFCKTHRDEFCKKCIGGRYEDSPTSLPAAAANIGSIFLYVFMSAFHAVELKTVKYNYKEDMY